MKLLSVTLKTGSSAAEWQNSPADRIRRERSHKRRCQCGRRRIGATQRKFPNFGTRSVAATYEEVRAGGRARRGHSDTRTWTGERVESCNLPKRHVRRMVIWTLEVHLGCTVEPGSTRKDAD